ncbi:hypothetical protein P7C70_g7963, partial [Phenoliferia sp. Uapishka_3]
MTNDQQKLALSRECLTSSRVPRCEQQAYFIAWQSPLGVGSLIFTTLALLILHPPFRSFLFPPRPVVRTPPATPSLDDGIEPADPFDSNGLDSDGLTEGEREELDARQFAQEFADLASSPFERDKQQVPTVDELISVVGGEGSASETELDPIGGGGDPLLADEAVPITAAGKKAKKVKKAKVKHLAKIGLPVQNITGDLSDAWERWANVLNPTPPFETNAPRRKVALHILPIIIAFLVLPSAFIFDTITFAMGFLFFGDPVLKLIAPAIDAITDVDWREAMQIR